MRFPGIDSLRGIAAVLVVFYHEWNRFYPHATSQSSSFLMPVGLVGHVFFFLFGYGYLGVSLFFVISGFCIHLPQAYRHATTSRDGLILKKFAKQRFFRLYPAYFASLILTSVALCVYPMVLKFAQHRPISLWAKSEIASLLFSAVFLQQLWPHALEFNGVYWTLLLEVQFYLCYPILLRICRRIGFTGPLVFLLMAECAFSFFPTRVSVPIFSHYFEWFLGMFLVERVANRSPMKIPFMAIPLFFMIAVWSVFLPWLEPLKWVFTGLGSVALIERVVSAKQESALTSKWLVMTGVFSYSLYLVHVPILDLFWNGVQIARKYQPWLPTETALLGVLFSFLVGYLFFLAFERPYLGAKKRDGNLPITAREQAW